MSDGTRGTDMGEGGGVGGANKRPATDKGTREM